MYHHPLRLLLQSPAALLRDILNRSGVQILTQRDNDKPEPFLNLDTEHWGPLISS